MTIQEENDNKNSNSLLTVDDKPAWDGFPVFPQMPRNDIDYTALAGSPLPEGEEPATRRDILPLLAEVRDPELNMSILDLGLLYRFDIDERGNVSIELGLTSAGCPFADVLPSMTAETVALAKGVGTVVVKIVWEPLWDISMMSDQAKLAFDVF